MATHSSVLAWRIPGTGEPGGLPSMGSHRAGHDWSDLAAAAAATVLLARMYHSAIHQHDSATVLLTFKEANEDKQVLQLGRREAQIFGGESGVKQQPSHLQPLMVRKLLFLCNFVSSLEQRVSLLHFFCWGVDVAWVGFPEDEAPGRWMWVWALPGRGPKTNTWAAAVLKARVHSVLQVPPHLALPLTPGQGAVPGEQRWARQKHLEMAMEKARCRSACRTSGWEAEQWQEDGVHFT